MQAKFGWIFPDGRVLNCDAFCHAEVLCNDKEALKYLGYSNCKEIEEYANERYSEAIDEFTSTLEPDEHPGWHNFSEYSDYWMYRLIYEKGFTRFGTYQDKVSDWWLETESDQKPDKKMIEKIMISLDCVGAKCNSTHYTNYYTKQWFKIRPFN